MIIYKNPSDPPRPAYKGVTLDTYIDSDVRIMSDVWADMHGALVWSEEEQKPVKVVTGNSEFGSEVSAVTLDATAEVRAKYEAWVAAEAAKAEERRIHGEAVDKERRHKAREAEARERLVGNPRKGDTVVVVKGRKVPKGTVGIIKWEGGNDYGPRIGMAVEGEAKLVYTSPSNVEGIFPGLKPGETPQGGWAALAERIRSELLLPAKGHRVRSTDNKEGKVMWAAPDGKRLGFKEKRGSDPIWVDTKDAVRLNDDGTTTPYLAELVAIPEGEARPIRNDTDALLAAASPASDTEAQAADEYLARKDRMAHLPPPFCLVREVRPAEDAARWDAFGEEGKLIVSLPAQTALHLQALLEGTA